MLLLHFLYQSALDKAALRQADISILRVVWCIRLGDFEYSWKRLLGGLVFFFFFRGGFIFPHYIVSLGASPDSSDKQRSLWFFKI